MNFEIELPRERAEYLLKELKLWLVDAEITRSSENWATIEVKDETDAETLIVYAFNCGVNYGREHSEN